MLDIKDENIRHGNYISQNKSRVLSAIVPHTCSISSYFRLKLDWCLPLVLQIQSSIKEIAKNYINGCKERNFKSHQWPIIGDWKSSSYRLSKVLDRIKSQVWQHCCPALEKYNTEYCALLYAHLLKCIFECLT